MISRLHLKESGSGQSEREKYVLMCEPDQSGFVCGRPIRFRMSRANQVLRVRHDKQASLPIMSREIRSTESCLSAKVFQSQGQNG